MIVIVDTCIFLSDLELLRRWFCKFVSLSVANHRVRITWGSVTLVVMLE